MKDTTAAVASLLPPHSGEKNQRSSNIELFRIIVMLLIVAHHYVVNSGLMELDGPIYTNGFSLKSIFLLIFGMWGKIGINCFVMITGYYMCKSKITIRKFMKLICEVYFYRFAIYLIFCITGYSVFSVKALVMMCLPFQVISTNFTSCFLLFYLAIPFLNTLVHALDQKEHQLLIVLCLTAYVFLGTFKFIGEVRMNYISWFIVLYFIASYLRLYPFRKQKNEKYWSLLLIILIILDVASVLCAFYMSIKHNTRIAYYFVSDSNTLLALLTGIAGFMTFKSLEIPYSKTINWIASSTFGVLCIHAQSDTMRQWLWVDLLDNVSAYQLPWMALHAIGSVVCIFVVCVVIDKLRIKFVEEPLI